MIAIIAISPVPTVCANPADSYGLIALSCALCQKVKTQSYAGHMVKTMMRMKKFFHISIFIPGTRSLLVFIAILPFLTLL